MGSGQSHPKSHPEQKSHRSGRDGRHGRQEELSIPGPSRQPNRNNVYGGRCVFCEILCDDLEKHYQDYHRRSTEANLDASMYVDREEHERPRYGKDMHPSNRNFSAQNTMTASSFDSQPIPLEKAEDERRVPPGASESVTSSYASQAPESPPFAVSNARTWDQTRRFQPQGEHVRPEAPFSEASGSSSGLPVPQYSERFFRRLDDRGTPYPVEDRSEGLDASQTARNQPTQDPREHPPPSSSYGHASAAGSGGYSYISPGSLSPRSPEYMSSPSPAPPSPQDSRGREHRRPAYYPPARSSSTQSEYRRHRGGESRESRYSRQHPPRSSETRPQLERQGSRHDRSRSRESRHTEARPTRGEWYDDTMAREDYGPRHGYVGPSRTPHAPSGQGHSYQTRRVVLPGDRTQFSRSDLQEMGDLRFGRTGLYDTRYDEGQYAEEEYDSDDHQFTTGYLRDMARIRNWGSG